MPLLIICVFGYFTKAMRTAKAKARYAARAKVMKALAHPTRLFIVDQLANGPRCVCELTDMVGADVSTVSRHLSVLREVGILDDDKRGNQVFYSLRVPCVLNWYSCVEGVLQADAKRKLAATR
jgi:ArsR family transcriptional regulator